jgi:hypothetical protein
VSWWELKMTASTLIIEHSFWKLLRKDVGNSTRSHIQMSHRKLHSMWWHFHNFIPTDEERGRETANHRPLNHGIGKSMSMKGRSGRFGSMEGVHEDCREIQRLEFVLKNWIGRLDDGTVLRRRNGYGYCRMRALRSAASACSFRLSSGFSIPYLIVYRFSCNYLDSLDIEIPMIQSQLSTDPSGMQSTYHECTCSMDLEAWFKMPALNRLLGATRESRMVLCWRTTG